MRSTTIRPQSSDGKSHRPERKIPSASARESEGRMTSSRESGTSVGAGRCTLRPAKIKPHAPSGGSTFPVGSAEEGRHAMVSADTLKPKSTLIFTLALNLNPAH
jgi:hypothetical protein